MRSAGIFGALLAMFVSSLVHGQTQLANADVPRPGHVEHAEPALWVEVIPGTAQLDPEATRRAIQMELGLAVVGSPDAAHVGKVRVEGKLGPAVLVRYESEDGTTRLERQVSLPIDPDRRCLVVSWVVGNLVRNEAVDILAGMSRRDAETRPVEPNVVSAVETANQASTQVAVSEQTPSQAPQDPDSAVLAKPSHAANFATTQPASPSTRDLNANSPPSGLDPARIINLALYTPDVALHRDAAQRRYHLSFGGIYSHIGALDGFGLTWLVDRVERRIKGAQISGVLQQSTDTRGAAISGIGSISSGSLVGAELAGLLVLRKGCIIGVQLAGLWASADSTCSAARQGDRQVDYRALLGAQLGGVVSQFSAGFRGVQLSGVAAIARERSVGLQLTGGVAFVGADYAGVQIGMLGNVAKGQLDGLQLSGLFNYQAGQVSGLQLSSGLNYAADVYGMQLGSVNVGRNVRGVQLGLVNVAQQDDGVALGLINWSKASRLQPIYFYETPGLHHLGFRILSRHTTSAITFGFDPAKDIARTHFALGPRVAAGRLAVGLEFGYGWVLERLSTGPTDRAHELDLIGTVTLEVIRNAVAIYGGGGVAMPVAGVVPIEPRGLAQIGIGLF